METTGRKDKVERMLRLNKMFNIILMPPFAWGVLNLIWPMAGVLWWMACGVLALIGMYYFSLITTIISVAYIYREHSDKILEELEPLTNAEMATPEQMVEDATIQAEPIIIALPENFLGTYKDFHFYEWLDLEYDDGTIKRVFFEGIADVDHPIVVQKDCMLLEPGLLYKHQATS